MRFVQSPPGRLLLLAAAVYLVAGGAALVLGGSSSLYAIGVGFPVGVTLSFIAIGLGMSEFGRETMLSVILLPPALWGFYYLLSEFYYGDSSASGWGWGMIALGALAAVRAAVPGASED